MSKVSLGSLFIDEPEVVDFKEEDTYSAKEQINTIRLENNETGTFWKRTDDYDY